MILFRTDGNETIGLGHVMRCLSIADALKARSAEVGFVTADHQCETLITGRGFDCFVLDTDYSDMEAELKLLSVVTDGRSADVIVVDSYYVTERYLRFIKTYAKTTVYIDDIAAFPYPVDILINYNIFSTYEMYQQLYDAVGYIPELLLGAGYVPLRKEFSDYEFKKPNREVKSIFISTGGADVLHLGTKLLQYLIGHRIDYERFIFQYVAGSVNNDLVQIKRLAEKLPNVELNIDVKDMCRLMHDCDLAVSAAGSTLYELCVAGVPTITYVSADNQIPAAKAFAEKHMMAFAGDARQTDDIEARIMACVLSLCSDYDKRERMALSANKTVKKNGSDSIADRLFRAL